MRVEKMRKEIVLEKRLTTGALSVAIGAEANDSGAFRADISEENVAHFAEFVPQILPGTTDGQLRR